MRKRTQAFGQKARDFGLPAPKGILLLGRPGLRQEPLLQGGRQPVAAAAAAAWTWARSSAASSAAPKRTCAGRSGWRSWSRRRVLWLDELEKAFAGTQSSLVLRRRDHGPRVRQLHHLAAGEDGAGVRGRHRQRHLAAPARVDAQGPLRRDLLRGPSGARTSGTRSSRSTSASGGATRRNFDLKRLAAEADGFSGAEIEQVVISALYDAFDAGRDIDDGGPDPQHPASPSRSPRTMKEQIDALREWAATRRAPFVQRRHRPGRGVRGGVPQPRREMADH